jgi:NitT/TauT family transport system substrate-binding protein
VQEQPEVAPGLVADSVRLDGTDLAKIWGIFDFRVRLGQALLVDLEDQTHWAQRKGLTRNSGMPNYLDSIYTDGLQAVRPESVMIIR